MAAPAYTTDLTDHIADTDVTAWGELVTMIAGGAPDEADTGSTVLEPFTSIILMKKEVTEE